MEYGTLWGLLIAAYLFCAGVSSGAFLTSSYAARKYPEAVAIRIAGRYISPVFMGIGLLVLMLDAEAGIKHPLRFVYLLSNWSSVMTIGTACVSIFITLAGIIAVLEFFKKDVNKKFEMVTNVFAAGSGIYTGFLIGVIGAIPLWNTAILPVLFFVSALSTGIAATMLVGSILDKTVPHKVWSIKKIHFGLMITELFLIFAMFYITSSSSEIAGASIAAIVTGEYSIWFWGGLIGLGLTLPIIIEGLELFNNKKMHDPAGPGLQVAATGSHGITATLITESSVLIGGFILRCIVLAAALPIPFL